MTRFFSTILFCALAIPPLQAANPGFQDFRGSNGILISVTGTGGSQKLVVGFKNGSSNFLANSAGVLVNNGAGLLSWAAVSQTNLFNSDQFAVGDGIVSIKDGALTTNLDVFNLLLGNANVYTDDGSNFLRNGVPIGGNQTITTNLTVVNESIFQGDTTFEGVNDFSGTSNIFNGPVYFNSNFVFNGILITNIGQVNSANYMPVSTGTNFIDSPIIVTNSTIATVLGSVLAESLRFTNGYRLTNSASAFSRVNLIHDGAPGGNFSIGGSAGALNLGGGLSSSITAISNLDIIHNGYTWRYTDDGFNPIFRPTSSNTHDIASALFPLRAIYVGTNSLHFIGPGFDSKLRSDADTLYLNDVPVGVGPWTDDGTNTILTNGFSIVDASGSIEYFNAADKRINFGADDGTNSTMFRVHTALTNFEMYVLATPDYNGSGLSSGFSFLGDGASGVVSGSMIANGTNLITWNADGSTSLSGTTNLIGDNGSGITWNGIPVGAQTPWTSDIDAAAFTLTNISGIDLSVTNFNTGGVLNIQTASNNLSMAKAQLYVYQNFPVFLMNGGSGAPGNDYQLRVLLDPHQDNGQEPFVFSSTLSLDPVDVLVSFQNNTTNVVTVFGDGTLSLSGQTNLIGMSAGGQLTVDGVAVGGGPPVGTAIWTNDSGSLYVLSSGPDANGSMSLGIGAGGFYNGGSPNGAGNGGLYNTVIGSYGMTNSTAPGNVQDSVAIGYHVLSSIVNGSGNIGISGYYGLNNLLSGSHNIGLGDVIMASFTNGDYNIGNGFQTLKDLNQGSGNVGIGTTAGVALTNGDYNVFIGYGAKTILDVTNSVALGKNATITYNNQMVLGNGITSFLFSDTNGLGGYITMTVSTNSGSAVATFAGSPPTATVPIDETTGIYTMPKGFASTATNATLAVVSTGITNTLSVNYRLFGFTGTTCTLTAGGLSVPLGTITVPSPFILQPGEYITGTLCAAAGGKAL